MSDQAQCTPTNRTPCDLPDTPSGSPSHHLPDAAVLPRRSTAPLQHAFRETLLWRFTDPAVAPALRLVGDALFDVLNEAHEWGTEDRDGPGLAEGELRAAAKDLDHLVEYLEEQVAALEDSEG